MKVAVCDDDIRFAGKMEDLVETCLGSGAECDVFLSAEEMLQRVLEMTECYQLYILDVEMPGMNGMEAAVKIREKDQDALIIFITSHVEKMSEAFDVNAFHYLVKPVDEEKARQVLARAMKKISAEKKFFTFQEGRQIHAICCDNILCFESRGRKMCVHTEEREYEYYGTLKEVLQMAEAEQFVRVHHAFLVNLNKIEILEREQMKLKGNLIVPISRTYRKVFLEQYQKHVMNPL